MKILGYKCMKCGAEYTSEELENPIYTCPKCGRDGILDVLYDYDDIKKEIDDLPNTGDISDFVYFFPIYKRELLKDVLKMPYTPLYSSNKYKNVWIKDEGRQPTGSLKDRASLIGIIRAIEAGYDTVCAASTGNAAVSLSGFAAKMGLKCFIFIPDGAPEGKVAQLLIYGAKVYSIKSSYDEVWDIAIDLSHKHKWYNRNCAYNPYLVEGKKSVSFEIFNQLGKVPDNVVVSIGDGCITSGVYKGFYDLMQVGFTDKMPRIFSVQSDKCAPMRDFYSTGVFKEWKVTDENSTIADSISVGKPRNRFKAMRAIKNSNGQIISVSDSEILEAIKLQGQDVGVFGEPAGSTAYAGMLKLISENIISENEITVVINTGNGLKDVKSALKSVGNDTHIKFERDTEIIDDYFSKLLKND